MSTDAIGPATLIQGHNDLACVDKAVRAAGFNIPLQLWEALPIAIMGPMLERWPKDHADPNKAGQFKYRIRDRQRAQRLALDLIRVQLLWLNRFQPHTAPDSDAMYLALPSDEVDALESVRLLPQSDIEKLADAAQMLDAMVKRQRLIEVKATEHDATAAADNGHAAGQ